MSHVLTGVEIEDRYGDPQSTEDPFNALADCEDALKAHSLRAKRGLRDPDASQRTQRTALKHTAAVMELAQLRDAYEKRAAHVEKRDRALIEKRRQDADKVSPIVKDERAMPLYDSVARVTREERTYSKQKQERPISDGGVSFFADLREAALGDAGAQLRLQRNAMEAETENRAATQSSIGANSVPQYLTELAALVARTGRPIASLCTSLQLPDYGSSLIIPRGTTGVSAAVQASEGSAASQTDEVWSTLTIPVVTIAGQQVVSWQAVARSNVDELVMTDLANAVNSALEAQILTGSGSSGQALGIQNTASINAATAFAAVPTVANFATKVAGQIGTIAGAGTSFRPNAILMHPRRAAWLMAQADSTGRPIIVPSGAGPFSAYGVNTNPGGYSGDALDSANGTVTGASAAVMTVHGLPVFTSAAIPTAVGTNSEDLVFVVDSRQLLLWEAQQGAGITSVRFDQTNASTLQSTFVGYEYCAFSAGRFPASIGKVGGLDTTATYGLVAPSF